MGFLRTFLIFIVLRIIPRLYFSRSKKNKNYSCCYIKTCWYTEYCIPQLLFTLKEKNIVVTYCDIYRGDASVMTQDFFYFKSDITRTHSFYWFLFAKYNSLEIFIYFFYGNITRLLTYWFLKSLHKIYVTSGGTNSLLNCSKLSIENYKRS